MTATATAIRGSWRLTRTGSRVFVPEPVRTIRSPVTAPTTTLKPCGTTAAYARHRRRGEPPCHACMEAHTEREKWAREKRALTTELGRLQAILHARTLTPPASRGWFCPHDGCWCLPLEDCPACAVTDTKEKP